MSLMSYFKKKVVFSLLTSTILSLAILSPVHAADRDEDRDLRVLKSTHKTPLLPDEKCQKKIRKFNKILQQNLSFQEQIQPHRDFYSALQKYYEKGSKIAEEELPIIQYNLALSLAKSSVESPQEIPHLEEALGLIINSANAGLQKAKEILPGVQNNLGVAFADSAEGSPQEISLLKKALDLVTASANAGFPKAKKNLPVIQIKLGIALANSAERSPEDNLLLRGALKLLTDSANAGNHWAQENLPTVQAALEQVSQHLTNLTLEAEGSTP